MVAVNQMLRAAMAQDGDESDEVKEEYGKKVDEGLASLRLKLEEARHKEAEEGTSSSPVNVIDPKEVHRSAIEKTPSHTQAMESSGTDARQLQMALAASQKKVQVLEAELKALQTKMLEYNMAAAEVSEDVQEATENIRTEYALKIDEILRSHNIELNTLRVRLHEEKANTDTLSAIKADLAAERANGTDIERRLERALSDVSTLEDSLEEQRRNSEDAIMEKDRALEVKDQDIFILQEELQELQDTQSRELDELKYASLRNSSALESEIKALRAKLVKSEANSLSASTHYDEFIQSKDREIEGMHQIIENLQDELQHTGESNERALDSQRIRLVQEHESILGSLKAEYQSALDAAQQQSAEAAQNTHLAHEQEIQDLLREHDIAQGDLQNSLAEMIASKTNLQTDVDSIKAGYSEGLSGYKAKLEKSEELLNEAKAAQQEALETIDQLKEQTTALLLERDEIKTDLEKASGEVTSLRQVLETFDDESKNKDEQHASTIMKLKDEAAVLAKTLDQTNAENSSAKEMHTSALQVLRDAHAMEIEELRTAWARKHDDAIQALQSQHDELQSALQQSEQQHPAVLEKVNAEHSEALEKLKTEHAMALEKHTQTLDEVKAAHSKDIEELKRALDRERKMAIQELQSQQTKLQETLKEAKEQHPAALEKLKAEHSKTLDKLYAEHSKTLDKHSETLGEVNNAHSKEIEELRVRLEHEYAQSQQEVEAKSADKASEAEEKHLRDLEALRKEHEQKSTELRKELEDDQRRSTYKMHEAHEVALSELRSEIEQQKEALAQAKRQLQAAQDDTGESQSHEALLDEVRVELQQAANVKKELESTLQQITQERDDVVTVVEELENLKRDLPIAKAEAEKHREAVEAANLRIKELDEKVASASAEAEEHKASHQGILAELYTLQSEITKAKAAASEATEAESNKIRQDLAALQRAADAEREQNTKLKALLQKAEETAEQRTTRIREVEAALKVTTAELTEMQTKRPEGCDFVGSPAPKGGLRLSRWAVESPPRNGNKEDDVEGEELGHHIEGTVGLPFIYAHI